MENEGGRVRFKVDVVEERAEGLSAYSRGPRPWILVKKNNGLRGRNSSALGPRGAGDIPARTMRCSTGRADRNL